MRAGFNGQQHTAEEGLLGYLTVLKCACFADEPLLGWCSVACMVSRQNCHSRLFADPIAAVATYLFFCQRSIPEDRV